MTAQLHESETIKNPEELSFHDFRTHQAEDHGIILGDGDKHDEICT